MKGKGSVSPGLSAADDGPIQWCKISMFVSKSEKKKKKKTKKKKMVLCPTACYAIMLLVPPNCLCNLHFFFSWWGRLELWKGPENNILRGPVSSC